jgi:hypothetical protein
MQHRIGPATLLVDEADSFIGDKEELRGILNNGFEASGEVVRVVEVKNEWQPIRFATFYPVALAGIGVPRFISPYRPADSGTARPRHGHI